MSLQKFASLALLLSATGLPQGVQFSGRQDIATHFTHLTGIAVADFNGDGKPDIAVTDDYTQTLVVYLNDGKGNFPTSVSTTLNVPSIGGLGALVVGDVNEDGKQDLIVGPVAGLQLDVVLLGKGDGTFKQAEQIPGSYGFQNAALVDINGDKHLDLIAGGNGTVTVYLGDGTGNFTQQPVPTEPSDLYEAVAVGDFEGNKRIDFVVAKYLSNQLGYYSGLGNGTFQTPTVLQPAQVFNPASLASADFNGDGKLDLLVGSSDIATLIFGNGDGTFQISASQVVYPPIAPNTIDNSNPTSPQVATADMDGNGNPDVVTADDGSDMLSVLLNDGKGQFPQSQPDFAAPLDSGSGSIRLADLNGDGLPDVIVTNYKTQNISIFLSILPKTTPIITVQSSATQALTGSAVSITVQVKSTGPTTPGGTVTLSSGTSSLGQQTINSSGQAMFMLQGLATGQYPLTASYSGDARNNSAINAATFLQSITDFQIALPTPTQTVAVGSVATYAVSLTPVAGLVGGINVSCTGLPTGYICAPVTANLNGQAVSANLIISPPAVTSGETRAPVWPFSKPLAICSSICICFLLGKRRSPVLLAMLTLLAFGGAAGCSGKTASSTPAPYTGTSIFNITATATQGSQTVSHQATATLTVH